MLTIRASEGGSDSKLLVKDMADVYIRSAKINAFSCKIEEQREGYIALCL